MIKYKQVIFDLDGTLLDTSEGIFNSVRYTEDILGLPPLSNSDVMKFIGPSSLYSYMNFHSLDEESARKAVGHHRYYSEKKGTYESKIYDGIFELLSSLKLNGVKLGVATLKRQDLAQSVLKHAGVYELFDQVFGMNYNDTLSKADIINLAINEMIDAKKEDTVLVGDSEFDAIGAKESGVDFIAVTYGFGFNGRSGASKYDNVFIASSPQEVLNFLS